MIHEKTLVLLRQILQETKNGRLTWAQEDTLDGNRWFTAHVNDREITFRFLNYEATNQIGADPTTFDFRMPFLNYRFSNGTEGFSILLEILGEAFESWRGHGDPQQAIDFLNEAFSPDRLK